MSAADDLPEPDRVEGAPHPRDSPRLYGQEAAERAFLDAYASGRLHHGWLLTGPQGVGKATLAWSIARFLLSRPVEEGGGLFSDAPPAADGLAVSPDHPVARRVAALSDPGLFLLRRGPRDNGKALSAQIRIDEVRKLKGFFSLSNTEGGRRVVIVDAADDLNVNAANALLKLLEEPPSRATMLLVAHQPARLLPTIRSRCRELRLVPLAPGDMAAALAQAGVDAGQEEALALAELSGGSVGAAVRLAGLGGIGLYRDLLHLLESLPRLDRPAAIALSERASGRGAEPVRDLLIELLDLAIARLARTGATGAPPPEAVPGEAATLARLAPDMAAARRWAELGQTLGARLRHGRAVNLDPATLILDTVHRIAGQAVR